MKDFWYSIQAVLMAIGGWLGWYLGGCDGLLYALLGFVVMFQKAREVLERLDAEASGRKPPERNVFTGVIRCPLCGKNYKRVNNHGRWGYNCSTYQSKGKRACSGKRIPESTLITESAAALGLPAFDEGVFKEQIERIVVTEPNHLLFVFKDGRTVEHVWKDRSRAESWTPEMKETARQRTIRQRRTSK